MCILLVQKSRCYDVSIKWNRTTFWNSWTLKTNNCGCIVYCKCQADFSQLPQLLVRFDAFFAATRSRCFSSSEWCFPQSKRCFSASWQHQNHRQAYLLHHQHRESFVMTGLEIDSSSFFWRSNSSFSANWWTSSHLRISSHLSTTFFLSSALILSLS